MAATTFSLQLVAPGVVIEEEQPFKLSLNLDALLI